MTTLPLEHMSNDLKPAVAAPSAVLLGWVDGALLSFLAAFVDTACFIGLFGLFTAHVTGNFVLIGAELVSGDGAILVKLLALPVFVLAVAATTIADTVLRARGIKPVAPILAAQGLLLVAALVAAAVLPTPRAAHDAGALITGLLAVAAMGMQNALMRLDLSTLPPSTVMTGNVTQFVMDMVGAISSPSPQMAQASRQRMRHLLPGLVTFTLGAAVAALAFPGIGLLSLALPAALCGVLAWRLRQY
jgi:uncharacterized membrane protein YoaK (UPF0700 family)